MNNEQFRRLLLNNSSSTSGTKPQKASDASLSPENGPGKASVGATPRLGSLGSKMRSSIPMTPRSVTNVDFARQLAEHRRENQPPPSKKFKSSATPKGAKLPEGYEDRSLLRRQADEAEEDGQDTVAQRVKALEEMMKLGQIDQPTFERLKDEIGVGGDVKSTHLVKGLDWRLLKRVKAGEDITAQPAAKEHHEESEAVVDIDKEFDNVLDEKEKDVKPIAKEEKKKKGTMAPPPPRASGQRMTRDELLKQLKASRAGGSSTALSPPRESTLGDKFKKIGGKNEKKRWIEKDEHGRRKEILITTDSEGKTKRKVRWLDKPGDQAKEGANGLLTVDKDAKPLGMEVPAEVLSKARATTEEEDDDDIFPGVGADYNPLAGMEEDAGSSSESESEGELKSTSATKKAAEPSGQEEGEVSSPKQTRPRNYFSTSSTQDTMEPSSTSASLTSDPTILSALKRAAAIRQQSPRSGPDDNAEVEVDPESRHLKFLEEAKRREMQDAMDMDLGFGGSRFEDDEEEGGYYDEQGGGNKRKRGPKKRKGDKDSAGDVMKVLEGRQKGGGKGGGKGS